MMASRKTGAGVSRPRIPSQRKGSVSQFIFAGAAIVVLIVVALLAFSGGGKKPAAPSKPKRVSGVDDVAGRASRSSKMTHARKTGRESDKARRREERRRQRLDARGGEKTAGRTSRRSSSGGYSRGSGSRGSSTVPNQLRAIITDGTGSRFALVGERRYKTGDNIEGRRILEVGTDAVKVEYRQNTYTVKVGQTVY